MPDLRLRLLLVLDQGVALYEARAAIEGDVQLLDLAKLGKPVIHICPAVPVSAQSPAAVPHSSPAG
jgi:hypothetical protein